MRDIYGEITDDVLMKGVADSGSYFALRQYKTYTYSGVYYCIRYNIGPDNYS